MNQFDDIKKLVNYTEKEINSNVASFSYLDFVSSDDEEYIRKVKQKNRELAVEAILDDKVDEYQKNKQDITEMTSDSYSTTTSMKVFQMNINPTPYNTDEDIYKTVISFLDQKTKSQKSVPNSNNKLDLQLSNESDIEVCKRKLTTRIIMCSNIIAMNGRIGPGTAVICGLNVAQYLSTEYYGGMIYIIDETIDPDKVIVCRSSNVDQPGLILVKDEKNKNFYFGQTPIWHKQYCWFWVK